MRKKYLYCGFISSNKHYSLFPKLVLLQLGRSRKIDIQQKNYDYHSFHLNAGIGYK